MMEKVERILRNSTNVVAITGAGISTASGIPDYRGEGKEVDVDHIIKTCSIASRPNDPEFVKYWTELGKRILDSKPTKAHKVLDEWYVQGKVSKVITQNIDCFHAPDSSIEMHGSMSRVKCTDCGRLFGLSQFVKTGGVCPLCKGEPRLVPQVVFFGQSVRHLQEVIDIVYEEVNKDTLLVIGTTLEVDPLKTIVQDQVPKWRNIIVVNDTLPSVLKDKSNVYWIPGDIQDNMSALYDRMKYN